VHERVAPALVERGSVRRDHADFGEHRGAATVHPGDARAHSSFDGEARPAGERRREVERVVIDVVGAPGVERRAREVVPGWRDGAGVALLVFEVDRGRTFARVGAHPERNV
jgi:hypothetical protein